MPINIMLCYDLLNKQCQNQQSNQHQRQERHTNILTKNIEQKCHVIKFFFLYNCVHYNNYT